MRLLTWVMAREMFVVAGLAMAALLGLITLGRMLQLRELFLVQGVGLTHLLRLFGYLVPFFLTVLAPAAAMLGVYLTAARMVAERELVALRAGGIGLGPLVVPSLGACLMAAALTLWAGLWGVAWGMEGFRETVVELARVQTNLRLQPGVFTQPAPGLTLYARQLRHPDGSLEDVFVQDTSRGERLTITAPRGRLAVEGATGRLIVSLEEGILVREGAAGTSRIAFGQYAVSVDLVAMMTGVRLGNPSPKEMGWEELWRLYQGQQGMEDANFARRVAIEIHKRPALALACPLLGLTMLALALVAESTRRQWGLVVGMGVFFVYYLLLSAGMSLAEGGVVPPAVGVWAPSVLFAMMAVLLLNIASTGGMIRRPALLPFFH